MTKSMASGDKLKVFMVEFSTFSVAVSRLCPCGTVVEPLTHSLRIEGSNPCYNTGCEKMTICLVCFAVALHVLK